MKTVMSIIKRLSTVSRELMRKGFLINLLIFVIVTIFLINMTISMLHNIFFQKDLKEKASVQNIKAVGSVLARTTEALLAVSEISMLRRAVAEAGVEHRLKYCRVILPDGGILADTDPKRITVLELPESWEGPSNTYTEKFTSQSAMFSFPLDISGRGGASLEIAADIAEQWMAGLESQSTQMAIACLALAAMLMVHHHVRFRLKAIDTIHEVLREVKDGKPDRSSLELDPRLGMEAVAWNKIIGQSQGQQISATIEQVRESIQEKSEVNIELTAACDALPYGLIVIGEKMCVDYANGAAASLLQASVNEVMKREVSQYITDQRVIGAIQDAFEGTTHKSTIVEVVQDGSTPSSVLRFIVRPVTLRPGPLPRRVRPEDLGIAVVIIEDITQQKVAEASRNSFLSEAAHELRTPLTNIRLYVERAIEDSEHNSPATMKYLNIVNEESQRLARTVSGILSVAEVEAGSFKLERDDVHLNVLLEQLKADYESSAREKQIALEFNMPPKLPILHADRDKILLALHNLLGNALKYTPENGRVTLKTTHEKGQINIAVTDTGIGIAAGDAERIFDKFYRAEDKRVAKITGSGLGLAIARQIIRQHGGDITVDSELNKGSTFTLTLPLTEEVT